MAGSSESRHKMRTRPPGTGVARGGRPTKWSSERVAVLTELHGRQLWNKRAAAKAAGIGYQTLMDWQRQRPAWRDALDDLHWENRFRRGEEAVRAWQQKQQARFAPRLKPRTAPWRDQPTKQMRLICWRLTHYVHPEDLVTEYEERDACAHFRLSWEKWTAAKARFPEMMAQVRDRRGRRLRYGREHGSVPWGWTPPAQGKARAGHPR